MMAISAGKRPRSFPAPIMCFASCATPRSPRCIACQMNCCVIDPFNNIFPVLDRLRIQQILIHLEGLNIQGRCKIRAPNFLKVDCFHLPNSEQRLAEAKLSLPNIVKPQVACGVVDAHSMGTILSSSYLPDKPNRFSVHCSYYLKVEPWNILKKHLLKFTSEIIQRVVKEQYNQVEHDSVIVFKLNHYKDLTVPLPAMVQVQEGTGDHVIVDVNYLPSFKEIPDDVAIPAFWDALKGKIVSSKKSNTETP